MVLKSNLKKFSRIIGLTTFILCFALLFISFQDAKVYAASWESESNNTRATADYISVNTTYNGNLKDYSDDDYYRFSTSSNGTVTVKFTHNYVATENNLWEVYLQDVNGNVITYEYVRGVDTDFKLTKVGLPAGTYYIYVNSYGSGSWHSTATYSVNAERVASSVWETEENDTRPLADSITVNKKYYGNVKDYSDDDYFKFKLTSKKEVTVKFTHNYVATENNLWEVYLQDASGNVITYEYMSGNRKSATLTKVGLPAGTYYIYVNSYGSGSWHSTATYSVNAIVPATSAPKNVYVKRYGHDDIKVSWSKVSAATGYYVYAKKTKVSKWTYLGSTTKTYYKKSNLTDGAKYHFKVIPYKKLTDGNYSGHSKTSINIYTLKKMSKPKFSKSGTKVKVIWSKISGADGYHVVQYVKKNGKYVKVKGYFTTNSSKLFTAKKGKTYYYKVRAYDKVGDSKIYAPYSSLRGYKR